jgi:hypothetical protein
MTRTQSGKIAGKLSDDHGASMVMALVFFAICAIVAAVVVTAASANADSTSQQRDDDEAYLAVSSATQMLKADLVAQEPIYSVSVRTKVYSCGLKHGDGGVQAGYPLVTFKTGSGVAVQTTPLMNVMQSAITAIVSGSSAYSTTFTISANGLEDVNATFTMDNDFNISITLKPSSTDSPSPYTMTLSATAIPSAIVTTNTAVTSDTNAHDASAKVWVWASAVPYYARTQSNEGQSGYGSYQMASTNYTATTVTEAFTVSWASATISRGA